MRTSRPTTTTTTTILVVQSQRKSSRKAKWASALRPTGFQSAVINRDEAAPGATVDLDVRHHLAAANDHNATTAVVSGWRMVESSSELYWVETGRSTSSAISVISKRATASRWSSPLRELCSLCVCGLERFRGQRLDSSVNPFQGRLAEMSASRSVSPDVRDH